MKETSDQLNLSLVRIVQGSLKRRSHTETLDVFDNIGEPQLAWASSCSETVNKAEV